MYSHEIFSDSIPLYIYYNCYFYHNLYDHVLSISRIFVHVINHISYRNYFYKSFTILFIHLNLFIPKYFLKIELPLDEFLGTTGSKFEYTYFKVICFSRSLVYSEI